MAQAILYVFPLCSLCIPRQVRSKLIAVSLQYLVLTLGDAKQATSVINKTLNPEWNQTVDFPIVGVQSLLLEVCCWDKDRFGKDYMGEFDVVLEDVFQNDSSVQEVRQSYMNASSTYADKP